MHRCLRDVALDIVVFPVSFVKLEFGEQVGEFIVVLLWLRILMLIDKCGRFGRTLGQTCNLQVAPGHFREVTGQDCSLPV